MNIFIHHNCHWLSDQTLQVIFDMTCHMSSLYSKSYNDLKIWYYYWQLRPILQFFSTRSLFSKNLSSQQNIKYIWKIKYKDLCNIYIYMKIVIMQNLALTQTLEFLGKNNLVLLHTYIYIFLIHKKNKKKNSQKDGKITFSSLTRT